MTKAEHKRGHRSPQGPFTREGGAALRLAQDLAAALRKEAFASPNRSTVLGGDDLAVTVALAHGVPCLVVAIERERNSGTREWIYTVAGFDGDGISVGHQVLVGQEAALRAARRVLGYSSDRQPQPLSSNEFE